MRTATSSSGMDRALVLTSESEPKRRVRLSEFCLAEGQRLAHMGSWAFDPDGFHYWSPELFRMHGLDPASKPPSVQGYLDPVARVQGQRCN